MRGEKGAATGTGIVTQGSPPHARGKGPRCGRSGGRKGITPACAGKSAKPGDKILDTQDHPRMRGEKVAAAAFSGWSLGSPPHARGKDPLFSVK